MSTKTAILVPGTAGLYAGIYKAAKYAAKKRALVTTRLSLVEALLRLHSLSKIVVIMGARGRRKDDKGPNSMVSAPDIYQSLKAIDKKVKIVVMDGWLWSNIPGQVLLTGKDTIRAISDQL
jgi:hypothetical protein